jgi:hypothetical protein
VIDRKHFKDRPSHQRNADDQQIGKQLDMEAQIHPYPRLKLSDNFAERPERFNLFEWNKYDNGNMPSPYPSPYKPQAGPES